MTTEGASPGRGRPVMALAAMALAAVTASATAACGSVAEGPVTGGPVTGGAVAGGAVAGGAVAGGAGAGGAGEGASSLARTSAVASLARTSAVASLARTSAVAPRAALGAAKTRAVLAARAPRGSRLARLTWRADRLGVLRATVPGAEAERVWWQLRDLVTVTGRWPVVRGDAEDGTDDLRPAEELTAATTVDPARWFTWRAREAELETGPLDRAAVVAGPRFSGHHFWSVEDPMSDGFRPAVVVALVPDPRPWTAAAYVGFGYWNDCPETAVHVALMHAWYDRWGAEPFALVDGVQAEMSVARPPRTVTEAITLGQEQYLYAYDDVLQGNEDSETREKFASSLIGYHSWQFWWD